MTVILYPIYWQYWWDSDLIPKLTKKSNFCNIGIRSESHHYIELSQCKPNKVFDPTRWEGNESNTLQDDHWFAFGHGPRACPGTRWAYLTMKMIIIEMIREYEIIPCANTPTTIKSTLINLKVSADKPLIVTFRKR